MTFAKLLTGLVLISYLFAGGGGISHSMMMTDHCIDGMTCCPFMGDIASVCNMSPLDHLSAWQNMFAAIPMQRVAILLLLLSALFFMLRFGEYLRLFYPTPQRIYIRPDPEIATYDSLRRFIARGLMHPKIF